MKNKIFAIALSILMAACLTACKGTAPDSQPGSNSQSISSSASASSQNLELLYGRVSEVAGNELTLDLAKLPGEDEAASAPENADGEVAAAVMAPAMEAGEAGGQTGASERTELDYTGESKSVVIPGGLKITGASGEEKQLTDIQKGSILGVFVNENEQVTEVVLYE